MTTKEYFPGIGKIPFEGKESKNPMAFHYYNAEKVIRGKKMKDWLRFSMAWWHTLCAEGGDQFGGGTKRFPWNVASSPIQRAKDKMDAGFEFMQKCGIGYYCFHDIDLVEEADTIEAYEANLQEIVAYARKKQAETGIKLLWGTANVFGHARYMNGAATNPDFDVVARAAVQIKNALDATIALGGENYVFWGGREGYMSLLNTDQKREKNHLALLLAKARDYARSQGFKGTFLIEPKPMEPMKHQYDADTETVIGFLKAHGLDKDFKVNIEVNHATLAGHTFEHELACAVDAGMLGSIDANRGDYQNGWDTDQFPIDNFELVQAMIQIIRNGGLGTGGTNFDAKPGATLRIWKISSLHTLQEWMLLPERLKMQTACYANLPSAICSKHAMLLSIQAQEKHSKKVNFRWKICGNMRSLTENPNKPAVNKNYTKQ